MAILGAILIGFFVGLLGRALTPGRNKAGLVITTLLGIGGAFMGSFLGRFLGFYKAGESAGFIGSVIGAILILIIIRFVQKAK